MALSYYFGQWLPVTVKLHWLEFFMDENGNLEDDSTTFQ